MEKREFIELLEVNPKLKDDLFIRGFLITDNPKIDTEDFPFYGKWNRKDFGKYTFLSHPLTGSHVLDKGDRAFFIMGHAYDPFSMKYKEEEILADLAQTYKPVQDGSEILWGGGKNFLDKIDDLTGVFLLGVIEKDRMFFLVDPSGMQSAGAGKIGENLYITSHPQMVADILDLKMDSFVYELIQYKWYGRVMGPYLPADLTPFKELKRVVPSQYYSYSEKIEHKRFWPLRDIGIATEPSDYDNVIRQSADILKNNMVLVSQKWDRAWISLTGGIDSNTTFAAANGVYDKFHTFSYISAPKEVPDAAAAKKIAEHFGLTHHEYNIPGDNSGIEKFEEKRELFRHNKGYIAELYDNEARKKFYLKDVEDCDVEVKSWVSETIRAYWYKHYGRKTMPKLSGKLFRNLYKIFLSDRSLAREIDRLFDAYIKAYEYGIIPDMYPPADMHYNEVTWGSWGGMNISEMKYISDLTFIYNNRRFLETMFRVPLEKRISDQHHLDMKKYLNKELFDMNIRVVNLHETKNRARGLNAIFTLNTLWPQ